MVQDPQHISDSKWVELIKQGDEKTWLEFFNDMKTRLLFLTKGILRDKTEASSIVTEAFAKLWKLKEHQGTRNDMEALLLTICRRMAYDWNAYEYKGGKARSLEMLTDNMEALVAATFEDNAAVNEIYLANLVGELHKAVEQLSGRSRDIMKLFLDGSTTSEIAETLNISIDNVRMVKKRAMDKLYERFSDREMLALTLAIVVGQLLND